MSRQELAEAVNAYLWDTYQEDENLDENDIGKLERGDHRWPGERRREAFRAVLKVASDAELGFYIRRGRQPTDAGPLAHAEADPTALLDRQISRREVLRCVCGGLIATDLLHMCDRCGRVQRVIQALDVVTSNGADQLCIAADSLDELVFHYSQTVCTLPPTSVYDDLFSVRSYAGFLLDRARRSAQRRSDVVVAAGWLSSLLAVVTCDMGDHAAALVWCSDAERRSREAGHAEIAAWAALTRVMIAFYQGHAGRAVALAGRGQTIAPVGTAAYAKLAAQEMRAWALLGKPDEMAEAKRRAAKAIAELPAGVATTGAFSINLAEDPPYTATSLLLVDRYPEAVSATNRVIGTVYRPEAHNRSAQPSAYARSLLILALAQAGLGRVDEAVAAGQAALDSARLVWPTMVLAGKLDQVLARDFASVTETADYHARYTEAASRAVGRLQLAARPEDRG